MALLCRSKPMPPDRMPTHSVFRAVLHAAADGVPCDEIALHHLTTLVHFSSFFNQHTVCFRKLFFLLKYKKYK